MISTLCLLLYEIIAVQWPFLRSLSVIMQMVMGFLQTLKSIVFSAHKSMHDKTIFFFVIYVFCYTSRNASILLECIQDSANDLRSSSYHLLSTYFPTALPSSASYPYTSSSEILCRALQLVSSPKLQESEAGALLSKMIFYK